MVTKFNGVAGRWLRILQATLIMLLFGAPSLTAFAATADEKNDQEDKPIWFVMVMTPDIMETSREVGGDWIAIQNLPLTDKPDLAFDGFIFRPINCASIHKKEILHKIVKDSYEIVDYDTWDKIPYEVFKEMPTNKILSIAVMPNPKDKKVTVRLILNKENYQKNPFDAFATDLSVTTGIRLWNIINEPGFK